MTADLFMTYLITAALLTMAPGLDTATVLRSAMVEGATHGAATTAGVAVGCFCWGSAAAFGLAQLFRDAPVAGACLRVAGALYLGYAGIALLLRRRSGMIVDGSDGPAPRLRTSMLRGFTTNILNPKVGIFYLTLLPQFAPQDGDVEIAWLLALVHVAIATVWFLGLSAFAGGIRPLLSNPRATLAIDRVTGGIFVLLGLGLIHAATTA
ncbi:threonine/homoserine/homoserine lactone efflux protein [Sphingomonas trueperi]|uniref:LysE family translocator n=1 Tax=Sphingomonas trueperi TaxID=53317 RepID=UPI0033944003